MTISISSVPAWISSLSDPVIKADASAAYVNGQFTENGLATLFTDLATELTQSNATLSLSQFTDLKTIASNLNSANASPYIIYITNALVNGNPANITYTGGGSTSVSLGNLAVGSNSLVLNELNSKWFLGTDLPINFYSEQNKDNPDGFIRYSKSFQYASTNAPLYSSYGAPSLNDINQGSLADCFLLSSLAEIAQQNPSIINNMITDNGNGTYGIRFFVNGVAEYVTTTPKFPALTPATAAPLFNQYEISGDMWANLVENAYAQIQSGGNITTTSTIAANSFSLIDVGDPAVALAQITGCTEVSTFKSSPSGYWKQTKFTLQGPEDEGQLSSSSLLQIITDALAARNDVILLSKDQVIGFNGYSTLEDSHCMSVIGVDTNTNNLIIRNPWGARLFEPNPWQTVFEVSVNTLASYGDFISIDNAGAITPTSYTIKSVNNWFQSVQFQSAAIATVAELVNQLNAGTLAQSQVWNQITQSTYTQSNVNPVITAYEVLFGRIPDQAGEQYWVNQKATGMSLSNLYYNLSQSPEFQAIYNSSGNTIANFQTIQNLYKNAFGVMYAAADTAGENWWLSQNLSNWQVALNIASTPQTEKYFSQAILGFELMQLAGNSETIPTNLSLFHFGGPY